MKTFEYSTIVFSTTSLLGPKLDYDKFTTRLNEYGAQAWELINIFPVSHHQGDTMEVTAVFKREKNAV
jgi:hypothetical protein